MTREILLFPNKYIETSQRENI